MRTKVRISIVTWNVGGNKLQSSSLDGLFDDVYDCSDIIIVGLQEVALARRGLKKAFSSQFDSQWKFGGGESYGGMRIFAFVKKNIEGLKFHAGMRVGSGLADRLPNKGAVAVEIEISENCRICLVSAHLAAKEEEVGARNFDLISILRRMDSPDYASSRSGDSSFVVPLFHRYDHVFFFGDLNYRLIPPDAQLYERFNWVAERIDAGDYSSLTSVDQLQYEQARKKAFVNFQEAPIRFAPTYKLSAISNDYNMMRIPSYCDRILWHSLPSRGSMIKCVKYDSMPDMLGSDHRPVWANFELATPSVNRGLPAADSSDSGIRLTIDFHLIRILDVSRNSKHEEEDEVKPYQPNRRHTSVTGIGRGHLRQPMSLRSATLPPKKEKLAESVDIDDDSLFAVDGVDVLTVEEESILGYSEEFCDKNEKLYNSDLIQRTVSEIRSFDERKRHTRTRSGFLNFERSFRMEVHGRGIFLKSSQIYKTQISANEKGIKEKSGTSLPAIPITPISSLDELKSEHIVLIFGKFGSTVGHSGIIPLAQLIDHINKPFAFELRLSKYGLPGRKIEACIQLVRSESDLWLDSDGRVVKNHDMGPARNYQGPLQVRGDDKHRGGSD